MTGNMKGEGATRMVEVSFSCTDAGVFPPCLFRNVQTSPVSLGGAQQTGVQLFPSTPKVDIGQLLNDLGNAGFVLVSVSCQERAGVSSYRHIVRFRFVPEELIEPDILPESHRKEYMDSLRDLASKAMWNAHAWQNPWFVEHAPTEDRHISACCAYRQPYVGRNGETITERLMGPDGRRIGDPLPICPDYIVRFEDDSFYLEPATIAATS